MLIPGLDLPVDVCELNYSVGWLCHDFPFFMSWTFSFHLFYYITYYWRTYYLHECTGWAMQTSRKDGKWYLHLETRWGFKYQVLSSAYTYHVWAVHNISAEVCGVAGAAAAGRQVGSSLHFRADVALALSYLQSSRRHQTKNQRWTPL